MTLLRQLLATTTTSVVDVATSATRATRGATRLIAACAVRRAPQTPSQPPPSSTAPPSGATPPNPSSSSTSSSSTSSSSSSSSTTSRTSDTNTPPPPPSPPSSPPQVTTAVVTAAGQGLPRAAVPSRLVAYKYLGGVPYLKALQLQEFLVRRWLDGKDGTDILLLLHHPPVYTAGRRIRGSDATEGVRLRGLGAEYYETKRGGQTTFHGPGQLVGYPILNLTRHGLGVRAYVQALENFIIATLARFGVVGVHDAASTGVWVDRRKIAMIGIHVRRHITSHGFAINCNTDLAWFDNIVPCGCSAEVVTSLKRELDYAETLRKYLQDMKLQHSQSAIGDGSSQSAGFAGAARALSMRALLSGDGSTAKSREPGNSAVSMVSVGDSSIDDVPMGSPNVTGTPKSTDNTASGKEAANGATQPPSPPPTASTGTTASSASSSSTNSNDGSQTPSKAESDKSSQEPTVSNKETKLNVEGSTAPACSTVSNPQETYPSRVFASEYEYQLFKSPTSSTKRDCSVDGVMPEALRAFEQVFGVELKPLRELHDDVDKQIDDFLRKP